MPSTRADIQKSEVEDRFEVFALSGEYGLWEAAIGAADLWFSGGQITRQFVVDEAERLGMKVTEAFLSADPPVNSLAEPIYGGVFYFSTYERPFLAVSDAKIVTDRRAVIYVAARKKGEVNPYVSEIHKPRHPGISGVQVIDPSCTAEQIAAAGDLIFWRDRGTRKLRVGVTESGGLTCKAILSDDWTAVTMAAGKDYLLWKDPGDPKVRRGKIVESDGRLQISGIQTIDAKSKAAVLAADESYVYWRDENSKNLLRAPINVDHLEGSATVIDNNSIAIHLASSNGYLIWKDEGPGTKLLYGKVVNDKLKSAQVMDENFRGRVLTGEGHYVYWCDQDNKLRVGTVMQQT
jgi:hypothetical protein